MVHVLILLLEVLTLPDTFASLQRAHQTYPYVTTTPTPPLTTIAGCVSSIDGQGRPPGSTYYPTGDSCYECTCDGDPWSNTAQENCRCANCNAMGTVIPAGRDVQVNGHTCRCQHDTAFPAPRGKRSAIAGRGLPAYGCEPFLQAICDPIITG
ncbi:uncharacterized protein LOC144872353 [Branchiostoma floridae x Branchiostoma japonicum]